MILWVNTLLARDNSIPLGTSLTFNLPAASYLPSDKTNRMTGECSKNVLTKGYVLSKPGDVH